MILPSFAVYILAILAGGCFVQALVPARDWRSLLLNFSLGTGTGLGLMSLLYFLRLLFFPGQSGYLGIETGLFVIGFGLAFWRTRRQPPKLFPLEFSLSRLYAILLSATLLILGISFGIYVVYALMNPHGGFDAWMIYNRTARFIFRGGENWLLAFSPDLYWQFHADYPPLIALNVVGGWNILGNEVMRVPQAHGGYFLFFGLVGLLPAAISLVRTNGQASLALLALLGTPLYAYEGPREAADLTLSYFVLATTILLYLYHRQRKPALLMLAGFMAGLGAWTKNEGLSFAVLSILACLLLAYRNRAIRDSLWFALGLALPLAIVLYFKLSIAPSNDLIGGATTSELIAKITDPSRYLLIAQELGSRLLSFGKARASVLVMVALYFAVIRFKIRPNDGPALLAGGLLLSLQFLVYLGVYVITPHDLDWHLRTSLARLTMHLFPAALFLLFAAAYDPETIFAHD